jgi:hypothetical protein
MFYRTHLGSFDEMPDAMRRMLGPCTVDDMVRQAIKFCWMVAPADRKNIDYVETEIRRLTEQALNDFGEDGTDFRLGEVK